METIRATRRDGKIVPDGPVDWPEGCRLRIEPEPVTSEDDDYEEGWPNTPEAIADWLAWYDSLEPLEITREDEAEIAAWRQQVKEYTKAKMDKEIEGLFP
jgi:hypothetical protein